jgi:hypothetical protein
MFRIYAAVLLVIISLAFPPLLVVTIPVGIIWVLNIQRRREALRRAFDVDMPTRDVYGEARRRALQSW